MSLVRKSSIQIDFQSTHPSIDNPYGFPLPLAGAIIIQEEVVKEGHVIKNLKRRLFKLVIDSDNFPCLIYTCVYGMSRLPYVHSIAVLLLLQFCSRLIYHSLEMSIQKKFKILRTNRLKRKGTSGW